MYVNSYIVFLCISTVYIYTVFTHKYKNTYIIIIKQMAFLNI